MVQAIRGSLNISLNLFGLLQLSYIKRDILCTSSFIILVVRYNTQKLQIPLRCFGVINNINLITYNNKKNVLKELLNTILNYPAITYGTNGITY